MKNQVMPLDYIIAIPICLYYWFAKLFDMANRCKLSPDGTHFIICKDLKKQCKYCGTAEDAQIARSGTYTK